MADEARVAQLAFEVIISATDAKARIAQAATQAVIAPTDAVARIGQAAIQALISPTDAKARVAQVATEILREGPGGVPGDIYVSQVTRETAVDEGAANVLRVSQTADATIYDTTTEVDVTQVTLSPIYETRTDIEISQVVLAIVRNNVCPAVISVRRPDFMPMFLGYPRHDVERKWEF